MSARDSAHARAATAVRYPSQTYSRLHKETDYTSRHRRTTVSKRTMLALRGSGAADQGWPSVNLGQGGPGRVAGQGRQSGMCCGSTYAGRYAYNHTQDHKLDAVGLDTLSEVVQVPTWRTVVFLGLIPPF